MTMWQRFIDLWAQSIVFRGSAMLFIVGVYTRLK